MVVFRELGVSEDILRALGDMGFEEPTPIQELTIPTGLAGRDQIGQAQTGTGKTAAFGIPLIEKLTGTLAAAQGIVLTPTRELAIQVAEDLNKIARYSGVTALPIYGGQDIMMQMRSLRRNPQIIVATPGRLMDHMRRGTIQLERTRVVVLDEADEMLNMGFIEDIVQILGTITAEHQTLLFSATMPRAIQTLAARFLRDPELVSVGDHEMTVPQVDQYYVELHEPQKFDALCRLLDIHSPESCIVFGRTQVRVDEVTEGLKKRGYSAEGLHGALTQTRRDTVLREFKGGITNILVATGVAARGLDVTGITYIYNFDIPQDLEGYVHRIGRTGRAGRAGSAVTFVLPREVEHLRTIERVIKRKILRMAIPTLSEAIEGQQRVAVDKLLRAIEEGGFDEFRGRAEELLTDMDSVMLVSAALKMLTSQTNTTPVRLTEPAPLHMAGRRSYPSHHTRPPERGRAPMRPYTQHSQHAAHPSHPPAYGKGPNRGRPDR